MGQSKRKNLQAVPALRRSPPPQSFQVAGHTYTIQRPTNLIDDLDSLGRCDPPNLVVQLDASLQGSVLDHTFMHEAIHAILWEMDERRLHSNEKFVDMLSNLLCQVLRTLE